MKHSYILQADRRSASTELFRALPEYISLIRLG